MLGASSDLAGSVIFRPRRLAYSVSSRTVDMRTVIVPVSIEIRPRSNSVWRSARSRIPLQG